MTFGCGSTSAINCDEFKNRHPRATVCHDEGGDFYYNEIELKNLEDLIAFIQECPDRTAAITLYEDGSIYLEDKDKDDVAEDYFYENWDDV